MYVLDTDNKAVYKQVQCGPLRDGKAAILAGLKADDRFVIDGLQRIRPGDVVDPKEEKPAEQKTAGSPEAAAADPAKGKAPAADMAVAKTPAVPAIAPVAEKHASAAENNAPNKQSANKQPPVSETPAADEPRRLAKRS